MYVIKNDGVHISLGILDPNAPLPEKLNVHNFALSEPPTVYYRRIFCNALVTIDGEGIISHCECSNCHNAINPFDKFCSNCGAKSKGRIILGENS